MQFDNNKNSRKRVCNTTYESYLQKDNTLRPKAETRLPFGFKQVNDTTASLDRAPNGLRYFTVLGKRLITVYFGSNGSGD